MLSEYPQIISSNRLSKGATIMNTIFKIFAFTIEFGFWEVNELIELLHIINVNVSSLIKFEEMVNESDGSNGSTNQLNEDEIALVIESLRGLRIQISIILTQVLFTVILRLWCK